VKFLYKLRQKNPKYCNDLIPSLEKNVFEQNILTVLPSRDQHGRRILITECGRTSIIYNYFIIFVLEIYFEPYWEVKLFTNDQ